MSVRRARLRASAAFMLLACAPAPLFPAQAAQDAPPPSSTTACSGNCSDAALIDDLEQRTFRWFWDASDPRTGLVPDRYPSPQTFASVASIGFGLTAYGIGASRHYITREDAADRTLVTLRYLSQLPQNDTPDDAAGFHGFFYHFLNNQTGLRFNHDIELSSIDTALLMQGVLFAQSFYDRDTSTEQQIRSLADQLYRNVDWQWMRRPDNRLSMGWSPEHQFIANYWEGYSEGMMVYILGLASPSSPLQAASWQAWISTNDKRWGDSNGQTFLNFAPLFGHQYSHAWIDFRGIQDEWVRTKNIDYFENSRRAAYAQRAYAIANPGKWQGYGANVWGLTASDGPGETDRDVDGQKRHFLSYSARGTGRDYTQDDGTIAPTAAAGSIAFAPEIVLPTLRNMKTLYGGQIYGRYGFVDAFNPTFKDGKSYWSDKEYVGIDQGPILLMIENWRSGLVWNVMKRSPYIRTGLERAGFQGGWLEKTTPPVTHSQATPVAAPSKG
ncbi:Tat pathway signal protein [Acetobacter estunensis]|uniref:Tat pathway signal protein n=2 Tax=Acetobacter estunensis TaxID=104097 RepID=A0A967B5X0_9PROT|nr:glucoamylase family protein [Acetobacter estunensis]NHO53400.1 Tat pathway signal protein [Acetobacter estunensis]